jgi:hypothetical protein
MGKGQGCWPMQKLNFSKAELFEDNSDHHSGSQPNYFYNPTKLGKNKVT